MGIYLVQVVLALWFLQRKTWFI